MAVIVGISANAQGPETKPLSAEAAQTKFQIEAGLKIELLAAEPLIKSPSALAWDEAGRLFVAENPGYPIGPGPGKAPVGAIIELRDDDGDHQANQRVEFATGLNFPNGLMAWRGGWLVTDAPELIWLSDTNADGKADVREVWFTGFATNQSTQLRACYPTLGPDGWIYVARGWSGGVVTSPKWTNLAPVDLKGGDFRFRPDGSAAEAIGGNAQFGMVVDDVGRRFLTSNRNPIMHAVAWPQWWKRLNGFYFDEVTQDVSPVGAEARVFPISMDLTTSGFMPEFISAPHAGTFTSACGLHQFFGEALPQEFQGNWFVCEPAQNLVQRQVMDADGPTFRSRRAAEGRDFLASSDSWFHPVFASTGPDGALYLADMYRKFIDHPEYLPKEAREKIDFDSGKQMGRIWRLSAAGSKTSAQAPMAWSAEELAAALASENLWRRQTAHRLILERGAAAVVPHLLKYFPEIPGKKGPSIEEVIKDLAAKRQANDPSAGPHLVRARIIRLLGDLLQKKPKIPDQLGGQATAVLLMASMDPSPAVREAVFRVFEIGSDSHNPLPDVGGDFLRWWAEDPSAAVRFHVAYCLGQGDYSRMTEALVNILRRDAGNRWMRAVVLSGLKERKNEFAEKWFASKWSELPGEPLRPIGFHDSEAMIALAYDLGRVYGASGEGDAALWRHAMAEEADGSGWQAALLAGLSQAARPGGKNENSPLLMLARNHLKEARGGEVQARIDTIARRNAEVALDPAAGIAKRAAAIRLIGETPSSGGRKALLKLLAPAHEKPLQMAAARSLAQGIDEGLAEALLARESWQGFSPELREIFLNALLGRPRLAMILLEAIERDAIPAWSINSNRKRALLRSSDAAVKERAEKIFGKAVGGDRLKAFNEYKSILSLRADARNGENVFQKNCASCHQHQGKGFKVGPDLSGVKNQPGEALLYHILVPDAEIYPGFQNYDVETTGGETHGGILVNESDSTITLQRALGEKEQITRREIRAMRTTSSSLMPSDLEKTMTRQELADLIAFLKAP